MTNANRDQTRARENSTVQDDNSEHARRERAWRRVQEIREASGGREVGDSGCN